MKLLKVKAKYYKSLLLEAQKDVKRRNICIIILTCLFVLFLAYSIVITFMWMQNEGELKRIKITLGIEPDKEYIYIS